MPDAFLLGSAVGSYILNVQFSSVGGQVVRVFAFQSDGLTSNPTEVYNISV